MYNIYQITNLANGRVYVGMTKGTINARFSEHKRRLSNGYHPNEYLVDAWEHGQRDLIVELVSRHPRKDVAEEIERRVIGRAENPYNIKTGKIGAMNGRRPSWGWSPVRSYIYEEICALRGKKTCKQLSEMFDCSIAMVSMVQNGHRTAPKPATSFKDVLTNEQTRLKVWHPLPSNVLDFYVGARGE